MEKKITLQELKHSPSLICYIENPSEEEQLAAVNYDGRNILYISNPTEAVKLDVIKNWYVNIKHISNPSEALQLEALKINPYSFLFINNPCEKAAEFIREKKPDLIKYMHKNIKTLINKICKKAKHNNPIYLNKVIKGLEDILYN